MVGCCDHCELGAAQPAPPVSALPWPPAAHAWQAAPELGDDPAGRVARPLELQSLQTPSPLRITAAAPTSPGTHLFETFFLASRSRRMTNFTPSSRSVTRSPILVPLPLRRSLHQLVKVFCWMVIQVLSAPAILEAPAECGGRLDRNPGRHRSWKRRRTGQDRVRAGCPRGAHRNVSLISSCKE